MNESTQPKAKKSLGQHFLRHESICNRIASLLLPKDTDNVIEIGPGPGALTRAIEAQPHARLVLLEKDSHWAAERQRLGAARTQAVLTDALRFDWSRITPDNPWKIIGNLPYNVASPMMWDLFSRATGLVRAAFMVQKEVADRMKEGPGSKDYGALSLAVQYYAEPEIVANVPPNCFIPRPNVGSAVIRLTRHKTMPVEVKDPELMFRMIRASFNQRRKTLQNGLSNSPELSFTKEQIAGAIESLGLPAAVRGEALSLAQFAALSDILGEYQKN